MKRKAVSWIIFLLLMGIGSLSFATDHPISDDALSTSKHEAAQKDDDTETNRRIANYTLWLMVFTGVLAGLGLLQIAFVYRADRTARKSGDAAKATAEAVNRGAETSEKNAAIFRERIEKQSRAYLSAYFGRGWYQDRATNTHFGMQVQLINTGHTPAMHVRNKIRCGIQPNPLTESVPLLLPGEWIGEGIIGPGQNFTLGNIMADYIDDDLAASVKIGNGPQRLYIWGSVMYVDVFEQPHTLRFCHTINWLTNTETQSFMPPYHNEGD